MSKWESCEETIRVVCAIGDKITSTLLAELSGVSLADCSGFLRCHESRGRCKLVGKIVNGKSRLFVYEVKLELIMYSPGSKRRNGGCKAGGTPGRTWEERDAPLMVDA